MYRMSCISKFQNIEGKYEMPIWNSNSFYIAAGAPCIYKQQVKDPLYEVTLIQSTPPAPIASLLI